MEPRTEQDQDADADPEHQRPRVREVGDARRLAQRTLAVRYQGPMPPPAILEGYDRIVPGSAARIIAMAEREQSHRHSMDRFEILYPYCGLALGAATFVASITTAIVLAESDKAPLLQAALVGVPVLGAIGWFVNARINRSERQPSIEQPPH